MKSLPWKPFSLSISAQESRFRRWRERDFGADSVPHAASPQRELHTFQANILEKQDGALGEAEMSLHLKQDFTHNPKDGGTKKVITCVSIEIPA